VSDEKKSDGAVEQIEKVNNLLKAITKLWDSIPSPLRSILAGAFGATLARLAAIWKEIPVWVPFSIGLLVLATHSQWSLRRLLKKQGTIGSLLAKKWGPSESLLIEPWGGYGSLVVIGDTKTTATCRVRFVNRSPYVLTVTHANLRWFVGTEQVNIAKGTFREDVIDPSTKKVLVLQPGDDKQFDIHEGETDLLKEVPSCAAHMLLTGTVNVRSNGGWADVAQRDVPHAQIGGAVWISVWNNKTKHEERPLTQTSQRILEEVSATVSEPEPRPPSSTLEELRQLEGKVNAPPPSLLERAGAMFGPLPPGRKPRS
jgi:hypothetical protein